eukprot:g5174.t1
MGNTSQKRKRKSMKVTPVPLRMIVLLGYLEIFRLGVMFTYNVLFTSGEVASISAAAMNTTTNALLNSSSSESTFIGENGKDMLLSSSSSTVAKLFLQASYSMFVYTAVYVVDTVYASFGYMSMYQHRMKHIFEHHIPGGIFTLLSCLFFKRLSEEVSNGTEYPTYYVYALYGMVSAGLLSQACEFYWVFRTFLGNPDAWIWRVVQRILGLVLVFFLAASSNVVIFSFLGVKYFHEGWTVAEMVAFPVLCYLCMWVQPRYTMCHWKRLGRLFSLSSTSKTKTH